LAFSPAYYAVRWIAARYSGDETDIVATVKLIAGMLLFPVSWLLLVGACAWMRGGLAAQALGVLLVVAALAALAFWDILGAWTHHQRVFVRPQTLPTGFADLRVARACLAEEMAQFLVTTPGRGQGVLTAQARR
jgi:hypothetical protein